MPSENSPDDKVRTRGTARMKELGMKQVVLWLDPRELALITAAVGHKKVATWIREKALHAAEAAASERRRAERREARGE